MGKETIEIEVPFGKKLVQTEMELGTLITFEDYSLEDTKKEIESLKKEIEKLKGYKDISSVENWILKRIESVEPKTDECGNVGWWKDTELLFEQGLKKGWIFVSHQHIWSVLEKEFGLNYNEIEKIIKNVMFDYTNNGKLTPAIDRRLNISINHIYEYDANTGLLIPQL